MHECTVVELSREDLEGRIAAILAVANSVDEASLAIRRNLYDHGIRVIRVKFDENNGNGQLINVAEVQHPRFGEMRIEQVRLPARHLLD